MCAVDECCDAIVARTLLELGYDAIEVSQQARGSLDSDILALATREGRILVTEDKDFGELILRRGLGSAGCILLRLPQRDSDFKAARIRHLLRIQAHRIPGGYVVVGPEKIRCRSLR